MEQTVYKLKKKSIGDWELPIKDILLNKIEKGVDLGGRQIKYIKGAKSIWAEDLPDFSKSEKAWFSKGFLFIPNSNKNLSKIANEHPYKDLHYVLFDKKADARKELEALKAKDDIIHEISNATTERIVATAMAVFGQQAFAWDEGTCELELRKYADKDPTKLKNELNSKTYESKYISALAFAKGVVRNNLGKTAVIWNDDLQGEILKLARGENGIVKLGEFLSKRTDESEFLLQSISTILKEREIQAPKKAASTESEKDKEIAALKKQLELSKKGQTASETASEATLEELQHKYKEKFQKDVPWRFKNVSDWIQKKLSE